MKTLYESILDTDFDVSIPGENLPGASKLMSILTQLAQGEDESLLDEEILRSVDKYLLRDLKNLLDRLAKKPVKSKPTEKWAIVCYADDVCQPRTKKDGDHWHWRDPEYIFIYRLDNESGPDSFTEYMFQAEGNLIASTKLRVWHDRIMSSRRYEQNVKKQGKYCIPSEICDLIDYVINSK